MKILHTSDWHLGKSIEQFSRIDEQREVLDEICCISADNLVDCVIIAGDLFDTFNPPTEAVDLFYKTLKRLSRNGKCAVIAIAGNHDSPDRIEAPDPIARECGIIFMGYPNIIVSPFELESGLKITKSDEGFIELKLPNCETPLRIISTPYANEFRLRSFLGFDDSDVELQNLLEKRWQNLAEKYCNSEGVNIMLTHLFMMKNGAERPEEPDDEKSILHIGGVSPIPTSAVPSQMQYVALGHLHRYQILDEMQCPVVYAGTPIAYSFSEANQNKYVAIIDVEAGQAATIQQVELLRGRKLLRKRVEGVEAAIEWLSQNREALVELTMVTDTYLSAVERKQLANAHNGIISIIPEVINIENQHNNSALVIDLTKNMEQLFVDYFKSEKGQEPNESLMNIFKEVVSIGE